MSSRAIMLLSGVTLAGLAAGAGIVAAQTGGRLGLRSTAPQYVAQTPADEAEDDQPGTGGQAASLRGSASAAPTQTGVTSSDAPPRASRPVQGPALRGVTQRQFRPPQPVVTGLPSAQPALPTQTRRRSTIDEDPYAPLGIRLGNILLRPAITESLGYDSNPQRSAAPGLKGSTVLRSDAELAIQSDWNVHELRGNVRAGYSRFFRDPEASRPDGDGNLSLRLDATRDTRFLFEARGRLDTQRPGSPELNAPVIGRPQIYQYGASAGVTHDINRLQLTLRGSVDRTDYEDARLTSGNILSQRDRNQTQYAVSLRAAYELTPGFKPFVQGEVDKREFDQAVDFSGYRRSSDGATVRAGSTFEISRLLTGELSVGYQDRDYEDGRLKNLRGIIGDIAVLWTPTPLTTVTLRGSSALGDTTIVGSRGTEQRLASIEVAHALRRNLILTGFATAARTDYDGVALREDLTTIGARLEYKLTRTVSVRTSFTHERLNSTAQGADYTANVALVGLRVQF